MRTAGILMPISSLPSDCGIGTLGKAAKDFLDFLSEAGQRCWQILPIGPTGYGDSPYQPFSSFAGNPYFIDLDELCRDGLLKEEEYKELDWGEDEGRVDYGRIYELRYQILKKAVERLYEQAPKELSDFCKEEDWWLSGYALFMALKGRFGGLAWQDWPEELRRRKPETLREVSEELSGELDFWKGVQYLFFKQWEELKRLAKEKGISIIGDIPIYVAEDSADVWEHPEQFMMDEELRPIEVAGCPPDGFSETGQLWGNPLFDWERMRSEGYAWWIRRVEFQFRFYDILRIDHFRGFESFYAIPRDSMDARSGCWRKGPGKDFFEKLEAAIGRRPIIAEDLGFITEEVAELLRFTGYPGMKVLEFAFDSRDGGGRMYQPHNYPRNCVAYVGTHDNDTALGWLEEAAPEDVAFARDYLRTDKAEGENWSMMRAVWASCANYAVVQMQDVLGLGNDCRMNTPSTTGGNWQWRALKGSYGKELAERLRRQMYLYERL